ncbi:hypothetical protein V6Z12_D04G115000 [Gossypium hirsutum]
MVQLYNFFFFIIFMVVPRGTAAPVLLKWFVSRDVSTGAPFSNPLNRAYRHIHVYSLSALKAFLAALLASLGQGKHVNGKLLL